MFGLILIIYASLSTLQCCEVEDRAPDNMGTSHWEYLLNVTELGRAAINGDVKKLETSVKGIFLFWKTRRSTLGYDCMTHT